MGASIQYTRHLNAAQGYLELDMPAEALEEIEALPPEIAVYAEISQLKLLILMRLREWEKALSLCKELQDRFPQLTVGYIHAAFCLHEMKRTQEAKQVLLDGPSSLLRDATYHYNLACYEAVLGNRDEALEYLRTSFAMNHGFRAIAKRDPDLASLLERM